ncbi:hypothetical protein SNEBB_001457, partial [Seison nebaliae]
KNNENLSSPDSKKRKKDVQDSAPTAPVSTGARLSKKRGAKRNEVDDAPTKNQVMNKSTNGNKRNKKPRQ